MTRALHVDHRQPFTDSERTEEEIAAVEALEETHEVQEAEQLEESPEPLEETQAEDD